MNKPKEESRTFNLNQIESVANALYALKDTCKIYTFSGPLGTGKTTLVKTLLGHFDIHTLITSPTFSYLNVYENNKGQLLYHFDLYRLKNIQEFLEAGFDEFLYLNNSWAFIEWPDSIQPLLTQQICCITLDYAGNERERTIHYSFL